MSWFGPMGQGVVAGLLRLLQEPCDAKTTIRTERTVHYHCGSIRPEGEGEELPVGRNLYFKEIEDMLRLKTMQWEADNFIDWNGRVLRIPKQYFPGQSKKYPRESPPWPICNNRPHLKYRIPRTRQLKVRPATNLTVYVLDDVLDNDRCLETTEEETTERGGDSKLITSVQLNITGRYYI